MLKETKIFKFFEQVRQEALRVVWPSRKELIASTGVVISVVIVFSFVCLLLDYGLHNIVQFFLNIGN